jgi:hypothetical protein
LARQKDVNVVYISFTTKPIGERSGVTEEERALEVTVAGGKAKKPRRPAPLKDGFSVSAWKSLMIKSVRIGWAEGCAQAEARIGKSQTDYVMTVSLFEDVFMPIEEFDDTRRDVRERDWFSLCSRDTHHGRGLSDPFCDLADESCSAKPLTGRSKELGIWIPPRGSNVFYTWVKLDPHDVGARRDVDETSWSGMPVWVLDSHTTEGRRRKAGYTPASGDYDTHRALGRRVMQEGWDPFRREFHAEVVPVGGQLEL